MGLRSKPRVFLTQDGRAGSLSDAHDVLASRERPEPITDVGTDEEQVIRRLTDFATTGDFGFDDSRDWGELLPTIPTLIGALHLLPEVLKGRTPEERERLSELLDAKFEEQLGDHDGNLLGRVLEPNAGMTVAYAHMREARWLRLEADALREANGELVRSEGTVARAGSVFLDRLHAARALEQERLEHLHRLHYTELAPTAEKTRKAVLAFEKQSAVLRANLLSLVEGGGRYSALRTSALGWLTSFEELKQEVRSPNPKRVEEQPTEDTTEEVYDDGL